MAKKEDIPPDEVRCRRTDGRQWRCTRKVVEGKKLCHIHYLQGRRRQLKQKVPESLKLERKSKKISKKDGEKIRACSSRSSSRRIVKMALAAAVKKKQKKRCVSEVLDEALRRMKLKRGDLHLELIREFLKRQVEKKRLKKKNEEEEERENEWSGETELTRELPNGIMAISQKNSDNAGGHDAVDVKIGENSCSGWNTQRGFRSKNIEPVPLSTMQVVAVEVQDLKSLILFSHLFLVHFQLNWCTSILLLWLLIFLWNFLAPWKKVVPSVNYLRRVKKCHWCRRSIGCNLIKCLKCRKQLFCWDCVKERYLEKKEIKVACPVCRETCSCMICLKRRWKEMSHKEFYRDKRKIAKIQLLHYLISLLLPVLKQINQEQNMELEMQAMITGEVPSNIKIQQSEMGNKKLCCCNNCKTSIVDYHRSCANCSYNLCLSCCWEFCRGNLYEKFCSKGCNGREIHRSAGELQLKINHISTSCISSCKAPHLSPMSLKSLKACSDGSVFCPPVDFGGCGERNLDLRCIFPLRWMKELEAGAEEVLQCHDFPETVVVCSCDSLCKGTEDKVEIQPLQKLAKRVESNDNFIYYPTLSDLNKEKLGHFQLHWAKGHPVIVRNVIRRTSVLNWDPVVMFSTYLERTISKSQNKKEVIDGATCLDWCEVETSAKQIFMGSMVDGTHLNVQHQTLKIKAWLSSSVFQEQFPSHYAEILHVLPLQEYLNPISGHLNIALKLPEEAAKPEIGPCIHISCGGLEDFMNADFLTKLCFDSNDVVNVLACVTDVPITREQFKNIQTLMKKYKGQDHLQSSRKNNNRGHLLSSSNSTEVKGKSSLHSEESQESGLQDMMEERLSLPNGIAKVPLFTGNSIKGQISCFENGNIPFDSENESEFDSESSMLCSGNIQGLEDSDDETFFRDIESSSSSCEKQTANPSGAQWDIFRRQDVPKLLEYLRRHSDELSSAYCYGGHVVHPILDQSFFLDAYHKMKLKEEFGVQPWTFEQHLGEAIMIPAGCPYQIRKLKPCVNVVLDFISPENTTECIRLTDEIRLLPLRHRARGKVLEVRKMTAYGISSAIEEIQKLMCRDYV
ncbi:lysine-specific demethylase JMJ25 isoform X2 [Coffea eugenioides]|uniref:lysine-specific demethylase JMJ25 isoform X2 n=1 Tax=Coffea eugenioides TaxID=49369 RepID=UPI000F60CBFC|nr:lysine-specific demethylase JMJ25 isoform X2 [Coffea eugenioides]